MPPRPGSPFPPSGGPTGAGYPGQPAAAQQAAGASGQRVAAAPHPGVQHTGQIPVVSGGPLPATPLAPAPKRRRTRVLVAIVIGAVVLVTAVVAVVLFNTRGSGTAYPVGSCVVPHGDSAQRADCSDGGASRVSKVVGDRSQCADPNGPAVVLDGATGDRVRCLTKVE
jgi:hypothetical protein